MNDQNEVDTNVSNQDNISPGAMLRKAREALRMTQVDIAQRLKVSAQRVARLEQDDYTDGAAPVYTRGYLRLYAQIVGVPATDVITAFNACDAKQETDKTAAYAKNLVNPAREPVFCNSPLTKQGYVLRWLGTIAIIVVVALAVWWWQGQHRHPMNHMHASPLSLLRPTQVQQSVAQGQIANPAKAATDVKTSNAVIRTFKSVETSLNS